MVKRLCASMESTVLHEWMRGAHLIERDCRSTSWVKWLLNLILLAEVRDRFENQWLVGMAGLWVWVAKLYVYKHK
jgi:hypothetical protein